MRRHLLYLSVILTLIGFGCQSSSSQNLAKQSERTLNINIVDEPQPWDPRRARDRSWQTSSRMLCDGLGRRNQNKKRELALAESVDISSDLKT